MRKYNTSVALCLFLVSSWLCNAALAAPEVGWWWNPGESGRGFFVESHNGLTFVGAYFYDDDGHAKWLVAGGQNADPYNYTGPLYAVSGGQTLFGGYAAPSAPTHAGNVTVHFSDDTHGTFSWPGGTVQIERQVFGGGTPDFQPYTGWWWNPTESGTGYSLEVQGNNLFVVGFMYDDTGRPVWYFSAGPMSTPTTYRGSVLQFANGQTMTGPYHPPGAPANVATLDVQFTDETHATFSFTGAATSALDGKESDMQVKAGQAKTDSLQPQFVKPSSYIFPSSFSGTLSMEAMAQGAAGSGSGNIDYRIDLKNVVLTQNRVIPGRYDVASADFSLSLYEVVSVPGGSCIGTGSTSGKLQEVMDLSLGSPLGLKIYRYVGIYDDADSPQFSLYLTAALKLEADYTCTVAGLTTSYSVILPTYGGLFDGAVANDNVTGHGTTYSSDANGSTTRTYSFTFTANR